MSRTESVSAIVYATEFGRECVITDDEYVLVIYAGVFRAGRLYHAKFRTRGVRSCFYYHWFWARSERNPPSKKEKKSRSECGNRTKHRFVCFRVRACLHACILRLHAFACVEAKKLTWHFWLWRTLYDGMRLLSRVATLRRSRAISRFGWRSAFTRGKIHQQVYRRQQVGAMDLAGKKKKQ